MAILVTGGAGYVGSHLVKSLSKAGYHPLVFDNLSEGHHNAVIGGRLIEGNLQDFDDVYELFATYDIEAVFHFAASCYVGESVEDPQKYYLNNIAGSLNLLRAMREVGTEKIIFSSSCAVYGRPESVPIEESHPRVPISPYGYTKMVIEDIMAEYSRAYGMRCATLRYFNAAGADPDAEIGESHRLETHLIPLILKIALGQRDLIEIYGTDYDTPDGTCIRDYVHVNDLARAHILAFEKLSEERRIMYNLGTGSGVSVLEVIKLCEEVTGSEIESVEAPRREGDPPALVASNRKAIDELKWELEFPDPKSIIETAWHWHKRHPYGFLKEKKKTRELFGEIAMRKEFITHEQLERALQIQKEIDRDGEHELIGMIMLREGFISNSELIEILKELEKQVERNIDSTN